MSVNSPCRCEELLEAEKRRLEARHITNDERMSDDEATWIARIIGLGLAIDYLRDITHEIPDSPTPTEEPAP